MRPSDLPGGPSDLPWDPSDLPCNPSDPPCDPLDPPCGPSALLSAPSALLSDPSDLFGGTSAPAVLGDSMQAVEFAPPAGGFADLPNDLLGQVLQLYSWTCKEAIQLSSVCR